MKELSEDEIEKIKSDAVKYAEREANANIYLLNNDYLTDEEKLEVELWFQFPDTIMFISLCICMTYSIHSQVQVKYIIVIPLILDFLAGVFTWFFKLKRFIKIFFLTIGHNFLLWAMALFSGVLLIINGFYLFAFIAIVSRLGLLIFISPSLFFRKILSIKYKMNAKYAYFKRFYDFSFPFEEERV